MTNNAIVYPIIYTATRLEAITNRFVFGPMGTTAASMKILGLLHANGPLTPRKIMELGGGTKSNVSQRLANLEKNGFIARDGAKNPKDKRQVIVRLTVLGVDQIGKIKARLKKSRLCLAKNFSREEIGQHVEFFKKINRLIDQEEKDLKKIFQSI
jgi:DNA-binding MarR family transcriptional regulator